MIKEKERRKTTGGMEKRECGKVAVLEKQGPESGKGEMRGIGKMEKGETVTEKLDKRSGKKAYITLIWYGLSGLTKYV